jgi:hypothetical protein
MWKSISSWLRPTSHGRNNHDHDKTLGFPADPLQQALSLRFRQYQLNDGTWVFTIEADISSRSELYVNAKMLFLMTKCVAIVYYCLLNRRPNVPNEASYFPLDFEKHEYLEVCLRLKRCGAAKVKGLRCRNEEGCEIVLEGHINQIQYLFGWPATNGPNEPVWVYYIVRTHLIPQGRLLSGGIEAQLEWESLSDPKTMEEYCEKLNLSGAVYYRDVKNSPEAWQMGLVRRATSLSEL